ncbi:MAG TPA: hypothetical protein PK971_10110 [Saprospiraceae bacterium]|nr:hypothetical protein [Saprospiraceae bacterium]
MITRSLSLPFLCLCLLFGLPACRKTSLQEYGVVLTYPTLMGAENFLLVTDESGKLLKRLELPLGSGSFSQTFTVEQEERAELMHYHLISRYGQDATRIYSSYGIRNGEGVYAKIYHVIPSAKLPMRPLVLHVTGIMTPSEIEVAGATLQGANTNGYYTTSIEEGQQLIIYRQNRTEAIYVPVADGQDTVEVPASAFKPIARTLRIDMPQLRFNQVSNDYCVQIRLVSANLQRFVLDRSCKELNKSFTMPLPEGVDSTWRIHLRLLGGFTQYCREEFLEQHPIIQISNPNLRMITKSSVPGQSLSIRHEGSAQWYQVYTDISSGAGTCEWMVRGEKKWMQDWTLPAEVLPYVPEKVRDKMFTTFIVQAFSAAGYSPSDMLSGFPWRLSDVYSAAQQGYEGISSD